MLFELFSDGSYVEPLELTAPTFQLTVEELEDTLPVCTEHVPAEPVVQLVDPDAPPLQLPVTVAPPTGWPEPLCTSAVTVARHCLRLGFAYADVPERF